MHVSNLEKINRKFQVLMKVVKFGEKMKGISLFTFFLNLKSLIKTWNLRPTPSTLQLVLFFEFLS